MTTGQTSPTWRHQIELAQTYPTHKTFTFTTTDAEQASPGPGYETAVDVKASMAECNKVSLIVELGDAYLEFDGNASTSTMLIPRDEGYFDDAIFIGNKISVKRATSTNVRVRGILWGR